MKTRWILARLIPGITAWCLVCFVAVQLKLVYCSSPENASSRASVAARQSDAGDGTLAADRFVADELNGSNQIGQATPSKHTTRLNNISGQPAGVSSQRLSDNWVQLCQYYAPQAVPTEQTGFGSRFSPNAPPAAPAPIGYRTAFGYEDGSSCGGFDTFTEQPRMPFSEEYRVRVRDRLTIIYQVSRRETARAYRISVGDVISIDSDSHDELKQTNLPVLPDGTISITPLQSIHVAGMTFVELKEFLEEQFADNGFRSPRVTVIPVTINLPNQDLRDAVDGRAGTGGQQAQVQVNWDGMIQLPSLGSLPVLGLTLNEVSREVNARYAQIIEGIEVTATLEETAPAFAYVLGEVTQQGQVEMNRPLTALQAITQAGGFLPGANMRSVVIIRRTADWRMIATRINLHRGGYGKEMPINDIWLHDGDIVIVPRQFIERVAELVNLYFTRSLYAVVPNQGFTFAFGTDSTIF